MPPNVEIVDDLARIDGRPVAFEPAKWTGGRIEPQILVLHDTASRLGKGACKDYLRDDPEGRKVSVHFVVERDGTITQLVPCDRRANHCEPSAYRGVKGCNGRSIGIEIVSPGGLTGDANKAVAWFGQAFTAADGLVVASADTHWSKVWLAYTAEQLDAVEALVKAIGVAYPSIEAVVTHYEISPGRKEDVGPHFPLERMRAALGRRTAPLAVHTVAQMQARLNELGYFCGSVDGIVGPRTRSALRTFQEQNALFMTALLDKETEAALFSDTAKEMPTGAREQMTAATLRQAGSATATGTLMVRAASTGAAALTIGEAIADADAQVKTVETGIKVFDSVDALVPKLLKLIDYAQTPRGLGVIAVLGLLFWALRYNKKVEAARVKDAQSGANSAR